jgi:hypothetical protein
VLDPARKILGMDRAIGPPVLELLQRLAKELQALTVDELDLPSGARDYDQPEMLSTIKRDSRTLSRSASSARLRSSMLRLDWLSIPAWASSVLLHLPCAVCAYAENRACDPYQGVVDTNVQ